MKLYQATFTAPHDYIPYFSESLENEVTAEEIVEDDPIWGLRVIYQSAPEPEAVKAQISSLFEAISLPCPPIEISEIAPQNWVEENQKSFPPIVTNRFYIYSEFSEASGSLVDIKINAGMAFGTGQHETTFLCLEAVGWLADEGREFKNILDLGCGSGILAIAAAKTWGSAKIAASDNDPVAVKVAEENFILNCHPVLVTGSGSSAGRSPNNRIAGQARDDEFILSEGFANLNGKYDLILANILMNPLLEMASDIAAHAEDVIVLSGFKSDQFDKIIERYSAEKFSVLRVFTKNHWVAAVLAK